MTERDGKVVLGWLAQPICGTSVIQQGFFDSFLSFVAMDSSDRHLYGGYIAMSGGYIAAQRDNLVGYFLDKTSSEWLLMLDWDITYSPDSVYALLDAADPVEKPIISGCYVTFFGGGNLLRPCWMQGDPPVPVDGVNLGEVEEMSVVGMGFTLMHRGVLEAMRERYIADPLRWFGHDIIGNDRVGEDVTFCSRARRMGYKVWGHGGVLLGHTKARTLVVPDIGDLIAPPTIDTEERICR